MEKLSPAVEIALAILVIPAAIFDIRFRRIPNWLVLVGICAGFTLNGLVFGMQGLARAALGFALALAVYLPLFAVRAMGGGDVKLMAAAGALIGPGDWFVVFLITAVIGGVMALGLLLLRGEFSRTVHNVLGIMSSLVRLRAPYQERPELDVAHSSAVTLPHGVSIAIGSLFFIALSRYIT